MLLWVLVRVALQLLRLMECNTLARDKQGHAGSRWQAYYPALTYTSHFCYFHNLYSCNTETFWNSWGSTVAAETQMNSPSEAPGKIPVGSPPAVLQLLQAPERLCVILWEVSFLSAYMLPLLSHSLSMQTSFCERRKLADGFHTDSAHCPILSLCFVTTNKTQMVKYTFQATAALLKDRITMWCSFVLHVSLSWLVTF